MVENNDNIQYRDEDYKKTCRRRNENPKTRWKMQRGRYQWNGWEVLNGNKQGNEKGNGIVNEEAWERVKEFRIGEK
jgi:hypothetical protein